MPAASAKYTTAIQEFDKVIEKEFPISSSGDLKLSNKYGKVNVNTWESNKVSIRVVITVKSKSEEKANKIFENIDISFSNDANKVTAETKIESSSKSWDKDSDFQINYEVKMPSSVHLNLSNKYGNSNVASISNGLDLKVKYGNAKLGDVSGSSNIYLGHGNLEYGNLEDLDAEISYSNVTGKSSKDTDIQSKHSKLSLGSANNVTIGSSYDSYTFGKISTLENDGKYDNFHIDEVQNVKMMSKFTDIEIDKVSGDFSLDQKHGRLVIGDLSCSSSRLNLTLGFTDVKLNLKDCNNYKFDFEGEYTDANLSGSFDDVKMHKDGKKSSASQSKGNGNRKMDIRMKYGHLKVM